MVVRRRDVVQAPTRFRRRRRRRFVKDDDVFAADVDDFGCRHDGGVVRLDRVFRLQLEREQDFAAPADRFRLVQILQ